MDDPHSKHWPVYIHFTTNYESRCPSYAGSNHIVNPRIYSHANQLKPPEDIRVRTSIHIGAAALRGPLRFGFVPRMWWMAASISSSRPARSPAMVGVSQMSGMIPTRWVGRLSG